MKNERTSANHQFEIIDDPSNSEWTWTGALLKVWLADTSAEFSFIYFYKKQIWHERVISFSD